MDPFTIIAIVAAAAAAVPTVMDAAESVDGFGGSDAETVYTLKYNDDGIAIMYANGMVVATGPAAEAAYSSWVLTGSAEGAEIDDSEDYTMYYIAGGTAVIGLAWYFGRRRG